MPGVADQYRAKERRERYLAHSTEGREQVVHRLSADLYAELRRQVDAQRTK
jgi:hypothetical protein